MSLLLLDWLLCSLKLPVATEAREPGCPAPSILRTASGAIRARHDIEQCSCKEYI
ncbi:hypothetical protein [Thermosporothrix hazakensis]|uniref:hypothetical protein n=1 Tax=Thermosporothrix hazakensis TaxID=644383 RepID=UPI001475AA53|nr:hypothetical protein [Thermosporothrix hazakensis]